MNCILQELMHKRSKIDKILEIIKDEEQSSRMTILSMVIDESCMDSNRSSREVWKMMYENAMAVHEECGEIGGKND